MKTLVWKELRENWKWAVLAMLVLGGAEIYGLTDPPEGMRDTQFTSGLTLTRNSFLTVATFGPAIVGFVLGLLQIIPEMRGDRWTALLHRPVSRGSLLAGKIVAGLFLYLLAAVPPFVVCVWLAARPEFIHTTFVPGLMLAGIADTLTGFVYYLGAMLVALPRGALAPLRALPLLAALHVSNQVVGADEFSAALAAVILMALLMGVAVWGTIHDTASFGGRPWPGKAALLLVSFYGLRGAGDLAEFILNSGRAYGADLTQYQLSEEDRPLKLTYVNSALVSVQELDGTTPSNANFRPDRARNHLRQLNICASYIGDSHGWEMSSDEGYRSMRRYVQPGWAYSYPQPEQWYYLPEQRSFLGMSLKYGLPVGRLDRSGFQPATADPVPFPADMAFHQVGRGHYYLSEGQSLRHADTGRRQITDLPLPLPGPVYGVTSLYVEDSNIDLIAVALSSGAAIYSAKNQNLFATLPYRHDVGRWGNVRIGTNAAADKFYVRYDPSVWLDTKDKAAMPAYIDVVNVRGEQLQSFVIPSTPEFLYPPRWFKTYERYLQSPAILLGSTLAGRFGLGPGAKHGSVVQANAFDRAAPSKSETAIYLALLSLSSAAATLFWARRGRMPWPQAAAWAACSLAFNVAGLILFRLLVDWPQLVCCAECGRPRPLRGSHCPECASVWPPPERRDTEILEQINGFERTQAI
jgi:hypothetical protein